MNILKALFGFLLIRIASKANEFETFYFGNNLVPHTWGELGADVFCIALALGGFYIIIKSFSTK